jgi:hypothetical protein
VTRALRPGCLGFFPRAVKAAMVAAGTSTKETVMSKNASNTKTNNDSKAPTQIAYHVREYGEGEGKKSVWVRIGALWPHKDGKGSNLDLDCVPLNGRIVLRDASEKKE